MRGCEMSMISEQETANELDALDEGSAKRRQILEGAREVFMAEGFDGASMNDVARVAGVSKGTLYVYFSSKEQLFETLIRERKRQQAERMLSSRFESADMRVALTEFGCELIAMMARPEHMATLRMVIAAAGKFPQIGRAFFEAGPCFGVRLLSAYLRRMADEGRLSIEDFDRAAWQFLDLCKSETLMPLLFRVVDEVPPERIRATIEAAVDMFLAIYAPGRPHACAPTPASL